MYIRRKAYSVAIDENGEEKLFSTTEIMSEESYLEKLYSENEPEQKEFNSKAAKKLNKIFNDMKKSGKIKESPAKNVNYSIEDKQLQLNAFNRSSPYTELRKKEAKKHHLSDYDHDNRKLINKLTFNKNLMKYWRD